MITIDNIRKEDLETAVYLKADVHENDKVFTLWYEVQREFGEYLVDEKADSFLLCVLPYAMASGNNVKVLGSPVSERLLWQLEREYLPALAKFSGMYKQIHIDAETTDISFASKAVGTGFSAGVDSFYTLLRNYNTKFAEYNITHVAFFNVGACGYGTDRGGEKAQSVFRDRISVFEKAIKELHLDIVIVNSNTNDFKPVNYNWIHSFKSMAAVLALQKLFSKYYYSSGWSLNDFRFDYHDSSYFDLFNAYSFSTESTQLYSVGLWESRLEKVNFISNYPITYKYLNVCNNHSMNCRTCDKCIRTMGELYSIGKLDRYKEVFDVDYFMNNVTYYNSRIIAKGYDGSVESWFSREIINKEKENKYKVSAISYIRAVPGIIKGICTNLAKKSKIVTRHFHKKWAKEKGWYFNDI